MIKKEKGYDYYLIQIDFEMGLKSLIKPKRVAIKKVGEKMYNKHIYEIEVTQIKDDSMRAWDNVGGDVLTLYFQSAKFGIEQINTIRSKR